MAGMIAILQSIPWPVFPITLFAISIALFIRNTYKFRKEFGKETTIEEIRQRYPRAKVMRLWRSKSED